MNKINDRKRILYLITKSNFGGAQRYVFDLATSLPKDQFDVTVALGGDGELKDRLNGRGIRIISIPELERDVYATKDFSAFMKILNLLREENPHVLHANSSKAGIMGALAGFLHNMSRVNGQRLKVIFTVHGWAFTEDRNFTSRMLVKFLQWLTVLFSHTTITVSENTKKEASDFPFVHHKIKTIHNGVGELEFIERELARNELLSKRQFPKHYTWIGIIAELHPNKGLVHALEAIESLKHLPCALFIIGDGDEGGALETLIKEKGLTDRVLLLGYKKNAHEYLKAFDIFILPSVKEGFPYAILEAGRAGLPVVASNIGGIGEVITHNETGFLTKPRSVSDIASALKKYIKDLLLAKDHATNLKKRVEEHFTLEKTREKTISHYL